MTRSNETWVQHLTARGPEQQAALSDLRAALLRALRGAVASRSVDESLLEDAVQDALVLILERLEQFEGRSRFLTWATAITIRTTMSRIRRRHWKDVSLEAIAGNRDFPPPGFDNDTPGLEHDLARDSLIEHMHGIIRDQLTEKQRQALLAELRGMPLDEIARHLGSNRNAVYKLTHDARRRLKHGLEAAGYGAADVNAAFVA